MVARLRSSDGSMSWLPKRSAAYCGRRLPFAREWLVHSGLGDQQVGARVAARVGRLDVAAVVVGVREVAGVAVHGELPVVHGHADLGPGRDRAQAAAARPAEEIGDRRE
jgi:hypothetical protein